MPPATSSPPPTASLLARAACLGIVASLAGLAPLVAQTRAQRPAFTYSIVAHDSATGQLGVAVQSHWFSVGSGVTWARAGIGAVATQSFIDPSYGALGLDMMAVGKSAPEALAGLVKADAHPEGRQVGMVDSEGRTATYTGELAIAEACDTVGPGFTVQANLMMKGTVCDAMVRAYTQTSGDLAERLLAALEAAQGEGGDLRGKQSAALLVVSAVPTGKPWADRLFDLRVEDHTEPLRELRRLVTVARAYQHMQAGDDHLVEGDIEGALEEYSAAERILPDRSEPIFWHAVTLAGVGRVDEALPLFRRAFEMFPDWRILVPRLPAAGILPDDETLLNRIVSEGR